MASLLQEAQQQGVLDVHLVMVSHYEQCAIPQDQPGHRKKDRDLESELLDCQMTVGHWRQLDGSKPGWKRGTLDMQKLDGILQVSAFLCLLV